MTTSGLAYTREIFSQALAEDIQKNGGGVFWFTGLPCSGKSTLAFQVKKLLNELNISALVLDSHVMRKSMCADLGFSDDDRSENMKRVANISKLFASKGCICLCSFVTPLEKHRRLVRSIVGKGFYEIFVSCSLEVCESRDVQGFYEKARAGMIQEYTGISSAFDIPLNPDLVLHTDLFSEHYCIHTLYDFILKKCEGRDVEQLLTSLPHGVYVPANLTEC